MDTRFKPYSWNTDWRQEELNNKYGERYHWCGKYLGNTNHASKGGPIKLANPDTGIKGLMKYLHEGHDLILLCKCQAYTDCHVSIICTMLLENMPEVEVVHCEPLSLGSCADCGEPATLRSPSGRLQGLACEEHGHCGRCNGSIEQFVLYHEGFICPCVAQTAEQIRLAQEMKQAKQVQLF
jgi:hypothetical protein